MFDKFKLFRHSANEKINKRPNYPGFATVECNGTNFMSEPLRGHSVIAYNSEMNNQYKPNVGPVAALSQDQFHTFPPPPQNQSFQGYIINKDVNAQRLIPMHIVQSSPAHSQRGPNEPRKSRSRETDHSKKDLSSQEPSAHSINRYERQKAKELYAALKQRDRTKFSNSPQITNIQQEVKTNCEPLIQKPLKIMSSQEFSQMIKNDPRLRQYVDNKNRSSVSSDNCHSLNTRITNSSRKNKQDTNNSSTKPTCCTDVTDFRAQKSTNIGATNSRTSITGKPQTVSRQNPEIKGLSSQICSRSSNVDTLSWQHNATNSGTDSSEYAFHYGSTPKYVSDFEHTVDRESSFEMEIQTEHKRFGYYSDTDSVLNPKFGKRESGTNTDLSDLVNQKLIGLRQFMNTSGIDPSTYLAYQKSVVTQRTVTDQSEVKDSMYVQRVNSRTARSSAGPTPVTPDDFQSRNSACQPYVRSNSARYSQDYKTTEKSFPQTIKLPYPTNSVNYIIKQDQGDAPQYSGSNLSLASNDSCRSTADERQAQEIRKLRQELEIAQQKVMTLSSRLSTNAHMASAFELSLMNMTERLQRLSETSEKKDHELLSLRTIIESLKHHNSRTHLSKIDGEIANEKNMSLNIGRSYSATVSPAHFHNNPCVSRSNDAERNPSEYDALGATVGIALSESCSSLVSAGIASDAIDGDQIKKQQKKGWLRSSLGKAFRKKTKTLDISMSDIESDYDTAHSSSSKKDTGLHSLGETSSSTIESLRQQLEERDLRLTDVQLEALSSAHQLEQLKELLTSMRHEMYMLRSDNERLQKMIPEEESIDDYRLLVMAPGNEYCDYNIRRSLDNRDTHEESDPYLSVDMLGNLFKYSCPNEVSIGTIVYLDDCTMSANGTQPLMKKVTLGSCHLSETTSWQQLKCQINALFKEYLNFIDPFTNLGISAECLQSFSLGDISRSFTDDDELSDTSTGSPFDLVSRQLNNSDKIELKITIRNTPPHNSLLDALAFDSLIPKTVLQRYVSLLLEHRLIILCGPSGTGKSYLANKLAKFLIYCQGQNISLDTLAIFTVDQKSNKELKTYLSNIADQSQACANIANSGDSTMDRHRKLPLVVILDNLHHVNSLAEIFDSFLTTNLQNCPYVIGTMTQASFSNTNLQAHHNFRWVLCANHMEPVKGFLGRYLRRKLVQAEWEIGKHEGTLVIVVNWISRVWQHINKFLESHSSSDVTIGPRLFLSCPMSIEGSQIWFKDLWNYSLVPYLLEAVREGLQTFGRRSKWEDPVDWILETWPWIRSSVKSRNSDSSSLIRLRPEDVGYDGQVPLNMISHTANVSIAHDQRMNMSTGPQTQWTYSTHNTYPRADPLFSILMKLQDSGIYATDAVGSGDIDVAPIARSNSLSRVRDSMTEASPGHAVFKTDIL